MQCGCGHAFDDALGAYGCPNCEGQYGPAQEDPDLVRARSIVRNSYPGWLTARQVAVMVGARHYQSGANILARLHSQGFAERRQIANPGRVIERGGRCNLVGGSVRKKIWVYRWRPAAADDD